MISIRRSALRGISPTPYIRLESPCQPFTISGGGNTVTFTPSSEDAGSYTYAGNMGGIGVHGSGTYRVKADDSGGTLTGTGNGCVVTPMGTRCAGGTERYTLTPIAPCAQE